MAVSLRYQPVDQQHYCELHINENKAEYQGDQIEKEREVVQFPSHRRWVFQYSNTAFVFVEVAVIGIAGGIKEEVQNHKCPENVTCNEVRRYRQAEQEDREQKPGEWYSQMQP